ncbi:MAG: PD-(D/E)XK nuclease family transposase [Lachnospiraceae bacterium]|nr:PD-(D/E)XK nuclease family transposase [Lachnospiraceae bacterium]
MSVNTSIAYEQATGPIDFGFTNDYMFRAILQKNTKVLKGLVCALLHLQPEDITSISVTNPIELGDGIDTKSFILDVKVQINYHTLMIMPSMS